MSPHARGDGEDRKQDEESSGGAKQLCWRIQSCLSQAVSDAAIASEQEERSPYSHHGPVLPVGSSKSWGRSALQQPAPRYLQPGPGVAVGQGPFEEGCHVFNVNVNGIVLLEFHLALLYGQVIDLDARNNRNAVCPQPQGCFL